jgi:hypothetical protein
VCPILWTWEISAALQIVTLGNDSYQYFEWKVVSTSAKAILRPLQHTKRWDTSKEVEPHEVAIEANEPSDKAEIEIQSTKSYWLGTKKFGLCLKQAASNCWDGMDHKDCRRLMTIKVFQAHVHGDHESDLYKGGKPPNTREECMEEWLLRWPPTQTKPSGFTAR